MGDLHLSYEALELPGQSNLLLIAFTTTAGSPDEDAIRLLSSWAATHAAAPEASPAKGWSRTVDRATATEGMPTARGRGP